MSGGAKLQVRVAEVVEVNELIKRFRFVARDGSDLPALSGGSHTVVEMDDQGTRRTYDCTTTIVGKESIEVVGRTYNATHVTELCVRPLGKLTNDYWVEGSSIRKSRQWVSGAIGYIDFERVID